jgi:hypothetical protein
MGVGLVAEHGDPLFRQKIGKVHCNFCINVASTTCFDLVSHHQVDTFT